MATYKRVDADQLNADLKAVADSIRAKTGETGSLSFPAGFVSGIESITGGGGGGGSVEGVHFVTFMNGDDVLYVRPVADGDTCADVVERGIISAPTKESTDRYDYSYYGWGATDGGAADSSILNNITADKTVYAIYASVVRTYTITYLDSDGTTVLNTEQLAYGAIPSYVPTKEGSVFDKWIPTAVGVTGDTSYTASWTDVVAKGTLSSKISWVLYTDGKLIITGTGAMPDYTDDNRGPFVSVSNDIRLAIKSIVVSKGITTIGDCIFCTLYNLTSVSLPGTIITIGENSFWNCSNLNEIEIPTSVTTIKTNAFSQTGLISLVIPEGVTRIERYTLYECKKLTTLTLPSTLNFIGSYCFYNDNALSSVIFTNPQGWFYASTETATSGTSVDFTDESQAASIIKANTNKFFIRTVS